MQKPQRYFALTALVALTLLGLTGCRSTPVEVLGVSGPDSLQVNRVALFQPQLMKKPNLLFNFVGILAMGQPVRATQSPTLIPNQEPIR